MSTQHAESTTQLDPPRFVDGRAMNIAGLYARFTGATVNQIPALWERFIAQLRNFDGRVGVVAYGVCTSCDSVTGFGYLSGVEVRDDAKLPAEWQLERIPAQRYAVFPHYGHVSTLHQTLDAIDREWRPASGQQFNRHDTESPAFFERYGEEFDPRAGTGGIEVWVPIKA